MAAVFEPIPHLHGVEMTKAQIATLFGEPLSTVDGWVRQGCPCRRGGNVRAPLTFDSAEVIAWRRIEIARTEGDELAARMVRLEIERDAAEAEVARLRR